MNVLVINDTRVDRHHGCYSVMSAIAALLERNKLGPLHYWPAHAECRGNAGFDTAIRAARLVVINGEGTIHHNRPAGLSLLEAGMHAQAAGVPVALINTGWEANGPDFVAMLDHFDLLAARDSRSAERMAQGGAKVRLVPDLSLWHALTHAPLPVGTKRTGIGFTDNVERLKSLALERLRRDCGGETVAISHGQVGPTGWIKFLRDGVGLRQDISHPMRLAALVGLRHRLWAVGNIETEAFLSQIARLELLVSGRFHACTLALATGTPVIAQSSNTGKIAALFHDAGIDAWRGKVSLDQDAVAAAQDRGWSRQERENLSAYLDNAQEAAEALFADLADLAQR